MSRSWIIRSSTTSTSRARRWKTLRRWASKNIGPLTNGCSGGDRGVEALQQAHLQDPPAGCRLSDQGIGLGQGDRDGLFQQDIESLGQGLGGHGIMRGRGHADGDRVQMQLARAACLQACFGRGKDGEVSLLAQHLGCGRIGIRNRGQPHSDAGLLQLAIDAQMIAAKGPGAEDGDAESRFRFSSAPVRVAKCGFS